jgi:hypothetical protein
MNSHSVEPVMEKAALRPKRHRKCRPASVGRVLENCTIVQLQKKGARCGSRQIPEVSVCVRHSGPTKSLAVIRPIREQKREGEEGRSAVNGDDRSQAVVTSKPQRNAVAAPVGRPDFRVHSQFTPSARRTRWR